MTKESAYSRGYDRGNYGNAYESQDWEHWIERNYEVPAEFRDHAQSYLDGMLLGFFSSYETREIGDEIVAEDVAALRQKYGEE